MRQEIQLDIFSQPIDPAPAPMTKPAPKPAPVARIPQKREAIAEAQPQSDCDKPVFNATGWYGTPETIAKLDKCLESLMPGDKWVNGFGVTETYLGETVNGHQLHEDPIAPHIYIKSKPKTMPIKYYQPTLGNGLTRADFTLKCEAHKLSDIDLHKPINAIRYHKNGDTWTGRGRKPLWVIDHLEAGGTLEDIEVTA